MIEIKYFLLAAGFLATFFYLTFTVVLKEDTQIAELNTLSEEIYNSANSQNYSTSNELLKSFEEDYSKMQASNDALADDEAVAVTASIRQTEKSIHNLENQDATAKDINDITSFRFLVDALSETNHPLWASIQPQMIETISKASIALQNNDYDSYSSYLSDFFTQYDVIYDSLKVDIKSDEFETIDQQVKTLKKRQVEVFNTSNDEVLQQMNTQLESLQRLIVVDTPQISDLWVFAMIFSFILLTLTFVGWRKYKRGRVY